MVLILDRVTAVIIRVKAIKILRSKAWVDNSVAAHGACPICSLQLLVAACLYVEPMRSCAKLGYDTSEVSVASLLYVWLASIAELDASVHCRLARSLHTHGPAAPHADVGQIEEKRLCAVDDPLLGLGPGGSPAVPQEETSMTAGPAGCNQQ